MKKSIFRNENNFPGLESNFSDIRTRLTNSDQFGKVVYDEIPIYSLKEITNRVEEMEGKASRAFAKGLIGGGVFVASIIYMPGLMEDAVDYLFKKCVSDSHNIITNTTSSIDARVQSADTYVVSPALFNTTEITSRQQESSTYLKK